MEAVAVIEPDQQPIQVGLIDILEPHNDNMHNMLNEF